MAEKKQPSEFFVFEEPRDDGSPHTETTVYLASEEIDVDLLVERLRRHHLAHNPPEQVNLIASENLRQGILDLAEDPHFRESLPQVTRYVDPPLVKPAVFDSRGRLSFVNGGMTPLPEHRQRKLMRRGLVHIFRERYGMLDAGAGFHYVNPSERHTKAFIRAGSVLLHSAEISFIAMGLLGWWPKGTRRIFTDTASINTVAYALTELLSQFDEGFRMPTIDSFSSYEGIETFDFDEREAFCIISASTSGNLVKKMTSRGFIAADRVVTLFYCGDKLDDQQILCDITKRLPDHEDGWEKFESYSGADACQLCRQGLATIRISGDQFLPATPEVDDITISQDHEPEWLAPTLNDLLGSGAVRCHADYVGGAEKAREIFIHLPDVLSGGDDTPFIQRLNTRLLSSVPASLERIVHLDDPSSVALAELVADHFALATGKSSEDLLVSEHVAREDPEPLGSSGGTVMVVAGAISTGRALLSVSQFLRSAEGLGHISYLIGVGRLARDKDWSRLRSNLTYGVESSEYPLVSIRTCCLPDDIGPEGSPWASEYRYLMALGDRLERDEADWGSAIKYLDKRKTLINAAAGAEKLGLTNDLFLPSVKNDELDLSSEQSRLSLREGFVFWLRVDRGIHPEPEKNADQSEVYLTIAAVLHQLRQPQPNGRALVQHEHNRTVLSPANFSRFNDGLIQACFLRAATTSELDYTHKESLSAQMRDIVLRFIEQRSHREGEAFPEFLLALARRRLNLYSPHEREVIEALDHCSQLPPFLAALVADYGRRLD